MSSNHVDTLIKWQACKQECACKYVYKHTRAGSLCCTPETNTICKSTGLQLKKKKTTHKIGEHICKPCRDLLSRVKSSYILVIKNINNPIFKMGKGWLTKKNGHIRFHSCEMSGTGKFRDRKQVRVWGKEERGVRERYGLSFWGEKNVQKLPGDGCICLEDIHMSWI